MASKAPKFFKISLFIMEELFQLVFGYFSSYNRHFFLLLSAQITDKMKLCTIRFFWERMDLRLLLIFIVNTHSNFQQEVLFQRIFDVDGWEVSLHILYYLFSVTL